MQGSNGSRRKRRLSPAMAIALLALAIALTGTAYAAIASNSVGPRQLQANAVKSSKFANSAVNGAKVLKHSLTGQDINLSKLGTVPSANEAESAQVAGSLGDHQASCPQGTRLIRGLCFDASSSGPVTGVQTASDACAARGGYLPTPNALFATRGILNLGDGNGVHNQFTDSYFDDPETKTEAKTMVVNETGIEWRLAEDPKTHELSGTYEYICSYPLVR
jgi:hypothetical protein